MNKVVAFIFLFLPIMSQAYNIERYGNTLLKWPKNSNQDTVVKLSINVQGDYVSGRTGSYDSKDLASLISAINAMNALYPKYTSFHFEAEMTTKKESSYDSINNIFFEDMGSNPTVAETSTTFFVNTGQIVNTDVRFNTYYKFLYGSEKTSGTSINLADVATHEFMHVAGFTHTALARGSLYFSAQDMQRFVSHDEIAGLSSLYPPTTSLAPITLSGTVKKGSELMFGAHVVAIRVDEGLWKQGEIWAGNIADAGGNFTISGLPNDGEYILFVHPIRYNAFGSYYNNAKDEDDFKAGFYLTSAVSGIPVVFDASESGIQILVDPNSMSNFHESNDSKTQATDLDQTNGGVLVSTTPNNGTTLTPNFDVDFYKLILNSGDRLDVGLTASEFRSPVNLKLEIQDSTGQTLAERDKNTYEKDERNPQKLDPFIFQFEASGTGTHYIKVSVKKALTAGQLPGSTYDEQLDSNAYVLTWHKRTKPTGGSFPSLEIATSTNTNCTNPTATEAAIICSVEEGGIGTLDRSFKFSESGTYAVEDSSINRLFIQNISFASDTMTVTLQSGTAGVTQILLKRTDPITGAITYRPFLLNATPVNDPPIILTTNAQTTFNIAQGDKINLTAAGIIGDDSIDMLGMNINNLSFTRLPGVIPVSSGSHASTVTAVSSDPNVSVSVTVENGNYMLSVNGAVGTSTPINLSVIDNNMSNTVASVSSKTSTSPLVATTSSPASVISGQGIIVNIVNAATGGGGGSSGGGGGGCFGGFTHGQGGNFNQFFNLFIFLIPLMWLVYRRREALCRQKKSYSVH
ncbi:MAG TPA: hypothetical protein VJB34_08850 [Bdellovibrionota bacterium]|nr:hypothetical protein [Bdellovibrionota bacterium]